MDSELQARFGFPEIPGPFGGPHNQDCFMETTLCSLDPETSCLNPKTSCLDPKTLNLLLGLHPELVGPKWSDAPSRRLPGAWHFQSPSIWAFQLLAVPEAVV